MDGNPLLLTTHNKRPLDPVHSAVLRDVWDTISARFAGAGLPRLEYFDSKSFPAQIGGK